MVRVSNSLIATLNILTILLSVPILGGGVWLNSRSSPSDCERFLAKPVIAIGVFLLLVSLAGLAGSCCRSSSCLLWLYLVVMFVLILLLFCFTVFAFVVTNRGAGEVVSGRGYKEYKLGDYSNWLQKRVESQKNWGRIRSCLVDGKVCKTLLERKVPESKFITSSLSPIQSGCCKPPTACNFTYQSETMWYNPVNLTSSNISDCKTWQNDQRKLCFDCDSCKAGVLANIKHDWKKVAVINIVMLIFLIIVYSVGCCAFRNNRQENSYRWKGYALTREEGARRL